MNYLQEKADRAAYYIGYRNKAMDYIDRYSIFKTETAVAVCIICAAYAAHQRNETLTSSDIEIYFQLSGLGKQDESGSSLVEVVGLDDIPLDELVESTINYYENGGAIV